MKEDPSSTRRCFLQSGLSVCATALFGTKFLATGRAATKKGVRFGVRGPFKEESLRSRAELLSRIGYEGIELGQPYLQEPAEAILEKLDGTGIEISAIVGSIKLLDPDPSVRMRAIELDRLRLRMARELGASAVIEVPTFGKCRFKDQTEASGSHEIEDRLLIQALRQLAPEVERTGVGILLEPLTSKETHFMNLQSHGARIIDAAGCKGVKLLSDFYHMQMDEKDVTGTLQQYGKYTGYVHLADGASRTEPGSLPYDYRAGFKALKAAGFQGWITIEAKASDEPEAALSRALPYIKQQWKEA